MSTTDYEATMKDASAGEKPYPPSWIDELVGKIDRLPGPAWLFYLFVLLLFSLLNNVVGWLDGTQEAGTFELLKTTDAFYIVYGVGFYHYLNNVATKALHNFRPALGADAPKEADLRYQLVTLPARWGWLAMLLGIVIAALTIQIRPADFGITSETSAFAIVYWNVNAAFSYVCAMALFIRTIKQLFQVNFLHSQVTQIDLFHLEPLRAFSQLTARAGFIIFLIALYNLTLRSTGLNVVLLVLDGASVLLALIIFMAPLMSIRSRTQNEKQQEQIVIDQRLKSILGEVNQYVDSGELSKVGDLGDAIDVLLKEREILAGISSVPWEQSTLREFASSVLLPVILWLVTRFLGEVL
jgi:hypothetical protein